MIIGIDYYNSEIYLKDNPEAEKVVFKIHSGPHAIKLRLVAGILEQIFNKVALDDRPLDIELIQIDGGGETARIRVWENT